LQKYEDIITASSKAVNALDKQYQYKFVSLADISTARTQQFNLISNYLEVYASITGYSSSLAGLLGIDRDTLILPSENIAKPNDWPISLNESILMSKNNNDQYKSLLAQAQSLQSKAEGLKLNYLPRLYMGVYGSFQYNRGYIDANEQPSLRQLNNNSATYWSSTAGIGLTMNFDGGQSIAAGQQAEYAGKSVQQQALGSQIDYVTRVKSAYQDLQTNKLRVEASEQAVKQSENVALVLKTIATMGIADTVQQVQSIDLYGNAVIGYATALRQAKIAEINLYRYTSTLPEQVEKLSVVSLHN
jgi:outer membrane protein TolC